MKERIILNQCDVCWKTENNINEVVECGRRGIRTYLLCNECYGVYKDLKRVTKR